MKPIVVQVEGFPGLEISKLWDEKNGRFTLLLKNGETQIRDIRVEEAYPCAISGTICFAKINGVMPIATASEGKITWKIPNLGPGEVKELVYTSLSRDTLSTPGIKKIPSMADIELFTGIASSRPIVRIGEEDSDTNPAKDSDSTEISLEPEFAEPEKVPEEPVKAAQKKGATVISVGAGKGGTGKTTFSINLGVALSEMGYDTLIMDADASMSNLATYIGMDPGSMKATLHEVLAGEAEPDRAVYRAFNDNLRIVPCGLSIEGFLKMERDLLNDVIEYFAGNADFIIIDTPAGYNKEVALSLAASDHLILVLNPDEGSMTDGLKIHEMGRILGVNIAGIVLNRYDMKAPQYTRAQIEQCFGTPIISMLPDEPGIRRKDRVPVVLSSPSSKFSSEVYGVAEKLSGQKRAKAGRPVSFVSRLMDALMKG